MNRLPVQALWSTSTVLLLRQLQRNVVGITQVATLSCLASQNSSSRSLNSQPRLRCAPTKFQWRGYAEQRVIKTPTMAESITEGTLKAWLKNPGDFVEPDEEIATIETDKVDIAIQAPSHGVIVEVYAKEEETVEVGKDLYKLEIKDASEAPSKPAEAESKPDEKPAKEEKSQPTPDPTPTPTPASKEESTSSSSSPPASKPASPPSQPKAQPPPQTQTQSPIGSAGSRSREEKREKLSRMRSRISERLKQSQNTNASLTTFNEVDMSNLMKMRKMYKEPFEKSHGVKLGFMSAFVKAAVHAMKFVPVVNARIEEDTIIHPSFVDTSVAVATPKGLVTPVVRNCESMTFAEVEQAIADYGKKARENKISIEDMAGGTFSISNGGVFGSMMGTPIINPPQSAILGLHAIKDRPVVINGEIKIRPMMFLALTYDHRLIDGREAVTFLVKIKEAVEDPTRMLLEL